MEHGRRFLQHQQHSKCNSISHKCSVLLNSLMAAVTGPKKLPILAASAFKQAGAVIYDNNQF